MIVSDCVRQGVRVWEWQTSRVLVVDHAKSRQSAAAKHFWHIIVCFDALSARIADLQVRRTKLQNPHVLVDLT